MNNILNTIVSSARTCYSSKIVEIKESQDWHRKETLLNDLYDSGHHTTFQHSSITFLLKNISRHLIWRLLHSHSFYNSSQISQRYVKMNLQNVFYPKTGNKSEWASFYSMVFGNYEKLIQILSKTLPSKKVKEIARYILPQGVTTDLYHTVNINTILRYIAVAKSLPEVLNEANSFVKMLIDELLKQDEQFKPIIEKALETEIIFPNNQIINKNIVFDIVGNLPELNKNYSNILNTSQMFFNESVLGGFSSYMKLSLSADAQNQRHRRSLGIRPLLNDNFIQDYYIPSNLSDEAKIIYHETIKKMYNFFYKQKDFIGFGESIYALPNAHKVEIVERIDFNSFVHKAKMRLCNNAQEEIRNITKQQVEALSQIFPNAKDIFMPPCKIRYKLGLKPYCMEGNRYCGIKVWES